MGLWLLGFSDQKNKYEKETGNKREKKTNKNGGQENEVGKKKKK